ncbi:MAG: DUF1569 domain-containing protein [Planctomycetaceae bacterium]|nr:DUF1569 domain-containing protein [Planctomycetaceae bacterium]
MTVQTKSVKGRRTVQYESFDDLLEDAEAMAHSVVETKGNWSLGQIFQHLASALESTIDGFSFKAPLHIRLVAPFLKKRFITKGIPPGFKLPASAQEQLVPAATVSTAEALDALRLAVSRSESESKRSPHPVFGRLTKQESDQLQLRHAEMHMSFVVPADE